MTAGARYQADANLLSSRSDGLLVAQNAVLLPIMAPRLQGDLDPGGSLTLALWAAGTLATVSFEPFTGPFEYAPNRVVGRTGSAHVAQSVPAMVLRGTRLRRLTPASRAAWWHDASAVAAPVLSRTDELRICQLGWGVVIAEQRGDDLILTVGADEAEARAALSLSVDVIVAEASAYCLLCDRMPEADPILRSMVLQGTHATLSSIRQDQRGDFAGLAAGQAYSAPARTYFRDGYWTLQPLLHCSPGVVRDQIRLLAKGIQPDGEAPSGVILSGPAQSLAWDRFRCDDRVYREEHLRSGDWWSDHFDSPLFFILALGDYVRETGDLDEARQHWPLLLAIHERYIRAAGPDGLPRKPDHDRDWADNVYREGLVSYDLGLWVGALDALVRMATALDPATGQRARELAAQARASIDRLLWVEASGHYADFARTDGFVEDHLTLDSLTLLRYNAVSEARALAVLKRAEELLESRNNDAQPYGDWGTLCAFPPFKRARDVRSKTAFAYRYHNGSDWPYLDAIYAEERLRRGLPGARYALTRWWEACLASGWAGAVEYYSPPFGRGSLLQGWSGLPAHVAVTHRQALATREKPASNASSGTEHKED
ncbi:MAG: GH116 family glycosyl hydrolase [Devosia sp.]